MSIDEDLCCSFQVGTRHSHASLTESGALCQSDHNSTNDCRNSCHVEVLSRLPHPHTRSLSPPPQDPSPPRRRHQTVCTPTALPRQRRNPSPPDRPCRGDCRCQASRHPLPLSLPTVATSPTARTRSCPPDAVRLMCLCACACVYMWILVLYHSVPFDSFQMTTAAAESLFQDEVGCAIQQINICI